MRIAFAIVLTFILPSIAGAQPQLQTTSPGIRVLPLRAAPLNADRRMAEGWEDYDPSSVCRNPQGRYDIFDCFEIDKNDHPTGGLACGLANDDSRWYYGPDACHPVVSNDLWGDSWPDRLHFAWFWTADGPTTNEHCYLVFESLREFDFKCEGFADDDFCEGIIFDFGPLESTVDRGYYYTDICLEELYFIMVCTKLKDRTGAYRMTYAQDYDEATGDLTLATCAQPMLWGTDVSRKGSQEPTEWVDLNNNGILEPGTECVDRTLGVCPEVLGAMLLTSAAGAEGDCNQLEVPILTAGQPSEVVGRTLDDADVIVLYAFDTGPGQFIQIGLSCAVSDLSPPRGAGVLGVTRSDAQGCWSLDVVVPPAAAGREIHFQAFTGDTCPDTCESIVWTRTVRP